MAAQIPYDPVACGQAFADCIDRLAELRFIDDAVAWFKSLGEERPLGGSWEEEVTFGTIHPVTMEYHLEYDQSISLEITLPEHWDARDAKLRELASSANTWAQGIRDSWYPRVDRIWTGTSDPYFATITDLATTASGLGALEINEDWSGIGAEAVWHGPAGESFHQNFLNPFAQIHVNHGRVLKGTSDLVDIARQTFELGEFSLINVLVPAAKLLDDQLRQRQASLQPEDRTAEFLVLTSAITGLAAAATYAFPPASAALWAISVGTSYASTQVPDNELDPVDVPVTSAYDVSSAVSSQLTDITSNLDTRYDQLDAAVDQAIAQVETMRSGDALGRNYFVAPRPAFVGDPDPSDIFYHESSGQA